MIKKVLLVLIVLAIIGAGAIYFVGSSALNKGVKAGVETFGPKVTQTPVTLESVNLSILSGSGTLKGLYVGNPEGFKSENIFALGQIDVEVDTKSLLSDKIVINKIHIKQPAISYEKTLTGSNVKALLKNIEEFTGPASEDEEPAAAAEEEKDQTGAKKQVVIKQLVIEDGTIYVGALGAGITAPLPRIEMNDIGEEGNQKSVVEVINLVLTEVLKSIGPAIANTGKLAQESGKAVLDAAKESGSGLQDVGGAATDTLKKAGEGIKSLFGNED